MHNPLSPVHVFAARNEDGKAELRSRSRWGNKNVISKRGMEMELWM